MMSVGAVLAGVGVLLVVVAYVARPFRKTAGDRALDRAIEAWIAQMEDEQRLFTDGLINNCSQCGHRVSHDDRYCSGCGSRLKGGGV